MKPYSSKLKIPASICNYRQFQVTELGKKKISNYEVRVKFKIHSSCHCCSHDKGMHSESLIYVLSS